MARQDDESFREFVAAGTAGHLRTAYLLVGDLAQAEDLLQSALIKTYLAWGRIRDPNAVHGYVRRVLVTTATSWRRRKASHEIPLADVPDAATPDFSGVRAEAETMRLHLLALPAKQRAALVLRYYEDLTEAEVAEVLGVSRGTVSRHITRGLNALRERVNEGELVP
jgi:RNA polymerase sigma-70 factor (sigma-E family)